METYGARGRGQPAARPRTTAAGVLAETPDSPGSLGHRHQRGGRGRRHPRRHEVRARARCSTTCCCTRRSSAWRPMEQMAMAGEEPDVLIGCAGGGSNFAGLTFPFLGRKLRGEADYRVIAVEPEAAPSLTRGVYRYDYGDTGKMAPIVKMHTLGSRLHAPSRSTRAVCATTACRRCVAAQGAGPDRGAQRAPARLLRGRRPVRARRGHPAGAREHARDQRGRRRGARGEGGRRGQGHPVQPVRPRPLRPGRVRALPAGRARGLRVPGREGRRRRWPPFRRSAEPRSARIERCPSSPVVPAAARSTPRPRWTRCSPRSGAARAAARSWTRSGARRTAATMSGGSTRRTTQARPPGRVSGALPTGAWAGAGPAKPGAWPGH